MCVYIYIYICIHIYIYIYLQQNDPTVFEHLHVCMHVCVYVCMFAKVCASKQFITRHAAHTHIKAHMYLQMDVYNSESRHSYVCMHACMNVSISASAQMLPYFCTYVFIYLCMYVCTHDHLVHMYESHNEF